MAFDRGDALPSDLVNWPQHANSANSANSAITTTSEKECNQCKHTTVLQVINDDMSDRSIDMPSRCICTWAIESHRVS